MSEREAIHVLTDLLIDLVPEWMDPVIRGNAQKASHYWYVTADTIIDGLKERGFSIVGTVEREQP